jgi:hypothetical protein
MIQQLKKEFIPKFELSLIRRNSKGEPIGIITHDTANAEELHQWFICNAWNKTIKYSHKKNY